MRPVNVVRAERLYVASLLLLVILSVMGWREAVRMIGTTGAAVLNVVIVGLNLLLLLWTTRRSSRIALWLLVILTGVGVVGYVSQITSGTLGGGAFGLLTTAQIVLAIISVALLFTATARAWFDEVSDDFADDDGAEDPA